MTPPKKLLKYPSRSLGLIAALSLSGAPCLTLAQNSGAIPRAQAVEGGGATEGAQSTGSYRLACLDLIAVNVLEEPELAAQARIGEDGTVVLPLIGTVKISGSTVKQTVDAITALYKQDYLVHPVVTVSVLEQTKGKLLVLGAVGKAGVVEVPGEGGIPILEAIAMAGGFTRVASQSRITVKRTGVEKPFKVSGKDQATAEKPFLVYPGDVISVAESIF